MVVEFCQEIEKYFDKEYLEGWKHSIVLHKLFLVKQLKSTSP